MAHVHSSSFQLICLNTESRFLINVQMFVKLFIVRRKHIERFYISAAQCISMQIQIPDRHKMQRKE